MASKRNKNYSETENNACVVCFKNVTIFSIGDCDHAVCYECSTRMRVLYVQNECPICRRDMPKVIFTKEVQPFQQLKSSKAFASTLFEKRFGIYFLAPEFQEAYQNLLLHCCSICKHDIEPFRTFHQLKEHMRRQHEVFYCDLCLENLKIFSFERRFYTRSQLALHRRKGDPDDKSHKGHPLCEFCDTRYMDSDELYRHLRRDHLYCHFCDADGKHHYYGSYDYLKGHFQSDHFLCIEGDCINERFTSVFRTEIDLKAHKASVHGKQLGKVGAKQARTLELEFRLAPRPRSNEQQSSNSQQQRTSRVPQAPTLGQHLGRQGVIIDNPTWSDEEDGAVGSINQNLSDFTLDSHKRINALDPELFPSLGGVATPLPSAIATKPLTRSGGGGNGITIRHFKNSRGLARTDENFPALSGETPSTPSISTGGSTLRFSVNSAPSSSNNLTTKGPNVSIQVNHRPSVVTARVTAEPVIAPRTVPSSEAFPTLGGSTTSHIQPAKWTVQTQKPKKAPQPTPPAPQPPKNFTNKKEFPTLSKSSTKSTPINQPIIKSTSISVPVPKSTNKSTSLSVPVPKNTKKSTSISVPVTNSWSSEESSTKSATSESKVKKKTKKKGAKNDTKEILEELSQTNTESSVPSPKLQKVERKRTELNIGNLKTPPPAINGTNFPVLGSGMKKPPGFDSWPMQPTIKNPPPGFKQPPPPGFNNMASLDFIAAHSAADLTFTNSSGQKYSILPTESNNNSYSYCSPSDFQQRNKKLIQNFMTALSDTDLNEFRQLSHLFKQGSYSAKSYYEYCKKCLGQQFDTIFPELLALLPDIKKQTELYDIYKINYVKKSKKQLDVCAICGQVVVFCDLKQHVGNHTLDNHFPVLGGTNQEISTAWKK